MYFPIMGSELSSFIIVMMLMIITPGVNQILVLQSGLSFGPKAATYNVLGIASSMFVHTSLSGLGISLLIMKSPTLLTVFKVLGAGYLIYLAISSIISAYELRNLSAENKTEISEDHEPTSESIRNGGLSTLHSQITNEKATAESLGVGEMTLHDIVEELEKPGRDPRSEMPKPVLRTDVLINTLVKTLCGNCRDYP